MDIILNKPDMNLTPIMRSFLLLLKSSMVSVIGLMAGMMITVFTVSYMVFENSHDSFHKKKKRITHVSTRMDSETGDSVLLSRTHYQLKEFVDEHIPQVELSCRLYESKENIFSDHDKFKGHQGLYVDREFFQIFDYRMIAGSGACLDEPGQIILIQSLARKLYGSEDCLGSELELGSISYTVCGIMNDPPANSRIQFDYLLPIQCIADSLERVTDHVSVETYFLFHSKLRDPGVLKTTLHSFFKSNGIGKEGSYELQLEGLTDQSPFTADNSSSYFLLISISLLALLISVVNFINSFAAGCELRIRDTGLRRVLGASRALLLKIMLLQSIMMSLIAAAGALLLTGSLMGPLRKLLGMDITVFGPGLWAIQVITLAIAILTGLLGGLFPAIKYTSANHNNMLKGTSLLSRSRIPISKVLVVSQFSISVSLLSILFLCLGQLRFLSTKDPGYEVKDRILIRVEGSLVSSFEKYKEELRSIPSIVAVSGSITEFGGTVALGIKKDREADYQAAMGFIVKDGFFRAYGIRLIEGITFEALRGSDAGSIIIDQSTARILGFEQAIGHKMHVAGREMRVIGLVEDAELIALRGQRPPFVYTQLVDQCEELIVHYRGESAAVAEEVASQLRAFDPEFELNYREMREARNYLYQKERNQVHMVLIVAAIALLITLGGAYAMTRYQVGQRANEICIRKVLGASVAQVVSLTVKEVFWMIGIAFLMAVPIAYFFSAKWLQNFTYRISMGPGPFILALLILSLFVMITVLSRTWKAALMNPAEKLRSE